MGERNDEVVREMATPRHPNKKISFVFHLLSLSVAVVVLMTSTARLKDAGDTIEAATKLVVEQDVEIRELKRQKLEALGQISALYDELDAKRVKEGDLRANLRQLEEELRVTREAVQKLMEELGVDTFTFDLSK